MRAEKTIKRHASCLTAQHGVSFLGSIAIIYLRSGWTAPFLASHFDIFQKKKCKMLGSVGEKQ
jgi:hypothetical protein